MLTTLISSIIERPCWVLFMAGQSEGVQLRSARPSDQWLSRADQRRRNVMQVTLANSLNDAGTGGPNVWRCSTHFAGGCAAIPKSVLN